VNGAVAWDGTSFRGANGIASADADGSYIYFRGVQPGTYSVSYAAGSIVPPITYQSLPGTWTRCAAENGTCAVSGASVIAFGAGAQFKYATTSSAIPCTNAQFQGDPIVGVAKWCYEESAPAGSVAWPQCAGENNTCSFTGLMTVAYGANGKFNYATLRNGTACSNAAFGGDPNPGTVKACYLFGPPPTFTSWTTCAAENGTCSFSGTHEVAFGANGRYYFGNLTGGTPCNTTVFGDPAFGTVKACYVQ
jgi:hypothetical protein